MQPLGETNGCKLAAGVGQQVRHRDLAPDGGDVDDRSIAARQHRRQNRQRSVHHAEVVRTDGILKRFERLRLDRTYRDHARIVHQHIHLAPLPLHLLDQFQNLLVFTQVTGDHQKVGLGSRATLDQQAARALQRHRIARGEHDPCAGAGKLLRDRQSKATGRAGYDCHLAAHRESPPVLPYRLCRKVDAADGRDPRYRAHLFVPHGCFDAAPCAGACHVLPLTSTAASLSREGIEPLAYDRFAPSPCCCYRGCPVRRPCAPSADNRLCPAASGQR